MAKFRQWMKAMTFEDQSEVKIVRNNAKRVNRAAK